MPCVLCPEGTCPPDCPFLEVFPIEAPYKTLKEMTESAFNLPFIKECLLKAKNGDEQKMIIEGMMKEKDRLELMAHIFRAGDLWKVVGVSAASVTDAAMDGTLARFLGP